ncbi:MAG: hypothetical protein KC656_29510 [Myxococcales bacterium]|nr:hypothetical protein [Myxococcales bacterium]
MITDDRLLAWRAGALEPPDALEVEEYVRTAPEAWARILGLPELEVPPSAWRIPPPGVRGGRAGFAVELRAAAVLGGGLRVGDRFRLALGPADPDRFVVVLRRLAGHAWDVVFPVVGDVLMRVADLPEEAGDRVLDLVVQEPGEQDWAVALPADLPDLTGAAGADWDVVLAGVAAGEVPVASARVRVRR